MATLEQGGLVAFPTDTVYGLAAAVWDWEAVNRLYAVKQRPERKAIPVLISDVADVLRVARPPSELAQALMIQFWPGPLTLVVRRRPEIPEAVSATDTIGVRVPDQAFARSLLGSAGPLAVTSANRSGGESATTAEEVLAQLGHRIDLVIDGGPTPGGIPSTVVDCTTDPPRVLREGPISSAQIQRALGAPRSANLRSG